MNIRTIREKFDRLRHRRYIVAIIILLYAASVATYALASETFTITSPTTVNPAPVVTASISCSSSDVACTAGSCSTSGTTVSCTGTSIDVGDTYTINFNLANFAGSSASYTAQSSNTAVATVSPASGAVPLSSGSGSGSVTVTGAIVITQSTAQITVNVQ